MPELFATRKEKRITDKATSFEDSLRVIHGEIYRNTLSLSEVLDFIPDAVFAIDLDKKVIAWNKAAEEMTGVLRSEMMGKGDLVYSVPFYGTRREVLIDLLEVPEEKLANNYKNIKRIGKALYAETHAPKINGGKGGYLWVVATPLLDQYGKKIGAIECIRDITAQTNVELELEKKTSELNEIIEFLPDATFVIDKEKKIVAWNKAIEELTGFSKEEMVGKDDSECALALYGELKPLLVDIFDLPAKDIVGKYNRVKGKGDNLFAEVFAPSLHHGKGAYLFVKASRRFDSEGRYVGAIESIRDITDFKEMQERIGKILESLTIPTWVVDKDHKIVYWNTAMEALTGVKKEDVLGTDKHKNILSRNNKPLVADLMLENKPDDRVKANYCIDCIKSPLISGAYEGTEFFPQLNKWILFTANPMTDSLGNLVGAIETLQDVSKTKELEIKLEEQISFLQTLIDAIPNPVFFEDTEARYIGCNIAFEEYLGKKKETFIGKSVYDLSPKDLADKYHAKDTELFAAGGKQVYESSVAYADGSRHSVVFNKAVFRKPGGEVGGLVGVILDITERKKIEDALKESEKRFMDVMYASKDSILLIDGNMFVDCNEATARMLGYATRKEFMMAHPSKLSPPKQPDGRDSFEKAEEMMRIASEKGFNRFEWIHRKANGEDFPVEVSLTPIALQGKNVIYCVWRDITERKRSEEAILFKNVLLEAQSETTLDGILVVGPNGKIILYNNRFAQLWNIPSDVLSVGDDQKILKSVLSQLKNPEEFLEKVEYLYAHHEEKSDDEINFVDGRVIDRYSSPMKDSKGTYHGRIWYFKDITKRKTAEAALVQKEEKLSEVNVYLENLLNYANAPIIVWDSEYKIIRFNHAFEHLSGYSSEEIVGRKLEVLFPENTRTDSLQKIANTSGGEFWESVEIPILCKDGGVRLVLWNSANIYEKDNKTLKATIAQGVDITSRKKAEDALMEVTEQFKSITETSMDIVYRHDLGGNLSYVSSSLSLLGYPSEEWIGKNIKDFVFEDDVGKSMNAFKNVLAGEKVIDLESRIKTKAGGYIFGEVNVVPLKKDGKIIGSQGSIHDITDRRMMEDSLRESEKKFRQLVDTIYQGIWVLDEEARTTFVNPRMADMMGYGVYEMLGRSFYSFMDEETAEKEKTKVVGMRRGAKERYELEFLRKDHSKIYTLLSISQIVDDKGNYSGAIVGVQDLTDRKIRDEELRSAYQLLNQNFKNEELLSKITRLYLDIEDFGESTLGALKLAGETFNLDSVHVFEEFGEGLMVRNSFEWCKEDCPSMKEKLQKIPYSTIPKWKKNLDTNWYYNPEKQSNLLSEFLVAMGLIDVKTLLAFQMKVKGKGTGFITFESVNNRGWQAQDVMLIGAISGIISNALERKRGWDELLKRNAELEENRHNLLSMLNKMDIMLEKQKQLERIKTEFLSITSHELRTPITPMKAQLQMILKEYFGKVTAEQKTSLEMILRNAVRLDSLIADILDISKIESGNMKFVMAENDLADVVKNAVETLRTNATARDIQLVASYVAVPRFVFDRDRITQVVINFLSNAIKFTDSKGKVEVALTDEKTHAVVKVKDSGIGISKGDQARLFKPFVQADSSVSRNHEGTGLGLAICKGIILNHGGQIGIESEIGKGATFYFNLPYSMEKGKVAELALFSFSSEDALKKFEEEIRTAGYVISPGKRGEIVGRGVINSEGKLKAELSITDLEKQGYITRKTD